MKNKNEEVGERRFYKMKRNRTKLFAGILTCVTATTMAFCSIISPINLNMQTNKAYAATSRQVEALDRGLVAIKTTKGCYLSWRYLGTDSSSIGFNIYRNGTKVNSSLITGSTNYLDASGTTSSSYVVEAVVNGQVTDKSKTVKPYGNNYFDIKLNVPKNGTTPSGQSYSYTPNDASVGDLDGDGEYEVILKWDPSNSQDNSKDGYTGNVYIDAYKLDGTFLWRIDLGVNIRAGAHYTQFLVYDFDGDGKSELMMKTADGTKDGTGSYIGDKSKDYRNSKGRILTGPEYLTLFEGKTGKALDTINYEPARGKVSDWGDSYGNRVDRFLATVAYLDGQHPSAVFCRGYYTRAVLVAYDIKNNKIVKRWTFDSKSNTKYNGQGNHNLAPADVDGDGYDEIVYGNATIDHNGKGLYTLGLGHGDALHVGDFLPNRKGLEVWGCFEESGGAALWDASNGKIIFRVKSSNDTGRCIAGNFIKGNSSAEFSSYADSKLYDGSGKQIGNWSDITKWGMNFTVYWDADLEQEALDRTMIDDYYNGRLLTASGVTSINTTKANPSLCADILGDWREEVIWPTTDGKALRVYMTTDVTSNRVFTLMHDTQYRAQVATQNVCYNQPAHLSFFLGSEVALPSQPSVYAVKSGATGNTSNTGNSGSTGNTGNTSNTGNSGSTGNTGTTSSYATIRDGWYYIKNPNANKYLQVTDNVGANGQNVEIGSASGNNGQKWYVTNNSDGTISLKNGLDFMLDVDKGKNEDGTNIQIWPANGKTTQKFMLVNTNQEGCYGIVTKVSDGTKSLDVYNFGTADGSNVCQWTYYENTCQKWVFGPASAPSSKTENSSDSGSTTTGNNSVVSTTASWNFSDTSFSGLGTMNADKTVNGLTLHATSEKTMAIKSNKLSYSGTTYSTCLALGGAGTTSYRSVQFDVNGACTITVLAKSSGSATRNLVLTDASGNVLGTMSCGSSVASNSFNYTGKAQTLYIHSANSGINLYSIQIR